MGRERAKCLLCVLCGICLAFLTQVLFDNLATAGSARIWIAAAILSAGVGAICLIGRGLYGFWNQKHKE